MLVLNKTYSDIKILLILLVLSSTFALNEKCTNYHGLSGECKDISQSCDTGINFIIPYLCEGKDNIKCCLPKNTCNDDRGNQGFCIPSSECNTNYHNIVSEKCASGDNTIKCCIPKNKVYEIIDISQYNEVNDFQYVANQVDGVIMRLGYRGYGKEGNFASDTKVEKYFKGFKGKTKIGFYFLTQAISIEEAEKEADYVHNIIKEKLDKPDFPIYLDIECGHPNCEGRADNLSKSNRTQYALAFLNKIAKLGYRAGVYANQYWLRDKLDFQKIVDSGASIWAGSPNTIPSCIYDIWQYSIYGKVNGVTIGNKLQVDRSKVYKDLAGWNGKPDSGYIKFDTNDYSTNLTSTPSNSSPCSDGNLAGKCINENLCDKNTHFIKAGLCLNQPNEIKCCLPKNTCTDNYENNGICIPTTHCDESTNTIVPGLCKGSDSIKCCIPKPISTDDRCGPSNNYAICPNDKCCSSAGWCDITEDHCGYGCQSKFGRCNTDTYLNYKSEHFSIEELLRSDTAKEYGINNVPPKEDFTNIMENLINLINNCLEPIRKNFGAKINVSSGYRNQELNKKVGSTNEYSQHTKGEAADLQPCGNSKSIIDLYNAIIKFNEFDQFIIEKCNWAHVSYVTGKRRHQILYTENGKSYKDVTNNYQSYLKICIEKLGLTNQASISSNLDPNEDLECNSNNHFDTEMNDEPDLDNLDTDNKEISDNDLNSSGVNKIKYTSFLNMFSILFIVFMIWKLHIIF
jgi:GH25 family lysozyme M1 (1,4-beta-N-acetylmuramidase)